MTATTPIAAPGSGSGYMPQEGLFSRVLTSKPFAVTVIVAAIIAIWYAFAVYLNTQWQLSVYQRGNVEWTAADLLRDTLNQDRPVLPSPHQVVVEIWNTTVMMSPTSRRSLLYHAWITLSATLLGFVIGTALGMALAVGIVHNRAMDKSVMPWVIASQTIPILAIAPMIIVVLNAIGITGLLPKALISTYLAFFPVAVGMVKGLRSPEMLQLDLLRTYSASRWQAFWKLRWPSSMPYLFTSMKVAIAISLVGAIVGELPTGAVAGLGARLLAGSYYGQTVQIWSALFVAAAMAAILVMLVGVAHRIVLRRMGQAA
jgi:NitT/TauT family transport system permease protein